MRTHPLASFGALAALAALAPLAAAAALVAVGCGSSSGGSGGPHAEGGPDEGATSTDDASTAVDAPAGSDGAGGDGASLSSDASTGADASCTVEENDAGTCSAVEATGPLVTATCATTEPPQAQGGTIAPGTYVLQAYTHYGNCPTSPDIAATTWVVCGDAWDVAQIAPRVPTDVDAGLLPVLRLGYRATVSGTSITFTGSCTPTGMASANLGTRQFTATSTDVTFIYPDPTDASAVEVSFYVRQ